MSLRLEDDHMCYVCGKDNPQGLHLNFEHPHKGKLKAEAVFSKHHQGFKNIVHGGMMAMVLDEMMVNLAWKEGIPAVTVEMRTRLKKASKVGEKIFLEGSLDDQKGKLIYTSSVAKNDKGEVLAEAEATCMRITLKE